jgi:diguanylate cyclase (GGDEF)-like protein
LTDFRRRYTDQPVKAPRQQISRLAFVLAGLLIAVTSVSLLFVGFVASHASRQQAIANEERLFRSTLAHHLRAIVREQISIAASDESVSKLVRTFDQTYARKSFDTLWTAYQHSKILLISGNGDVLAESFKDYTHIITRPIAETPGLEQIVEKMQSLYRKNRVRVPGGFGHRSLQGLDPAEYAVMGFVRIDGKPALFGAMPIIPDAYRTTLPDGPPSVLLSAHYIDDVQLRQLNDQLNFADFSFSDIQPAASAGPGHTISDQSGIPLGTFTWKSKTVGESIWPTIVPVIVVLSAALGLLAFGIAWRIGQLTTSLQASERQNRYLALHDTLSGLGNRLQFNRVLASSVKSLPGKPFSVIHCDLDEFKAVNDTYGHAVGDTVIRVMAERLTEVIGTPGLVCRIGGDEFMVIYRGSTERADLEALCEALVASARTPISLPEGHDTRIGLSVGLATAPQDGVTPEDLVARSDAALYRSKNLGRNMYSLYCDLAGEDAAAVRTPQRASGGAAG